jgi:hypothetical protein
MLGQVRNAMPLDSRLPCRAVLHRRAVPCHYDLYQARRINEASGLSNLLPSPSLIPMPRVMTVRLVRSAIAGNSTAGKIYARPDLHKLMIVRSSCGVGREELI